MLTRRQAGFGLEVFQSVGQAHRVLQLHLGLEGVELPEGRGGRCSTGDSAQEALKDREGNVRPLCRR